ncbi:MAG: hypothetical protein KTR31_03770 [Myxococcales bacterium]|nr:hypothetical protein [Myxococcales bacterium]
MGYDITFQIVSVHQLQQVFRHLVDGEPPPPSPFDDRDDAEVVWSEARRRVLAGPAEDAAKTACQLAALWSASSHPFVWTRNLGITYHPLRMEDELQGLPSTGFGSVPWFLEPVLDLRPELRPHVPTYLDGNYTTGGYCRDPERAAEAVKAFWRELPPNLQSRITPLLTLLRAAQREGTGVLEATDLLGVPDAEQPRLAWPGLQRSPLGEGPLTAEEWAATAAVWRTRDVDGTNALGDMEDLLDEVLRADVSDEAVLRPVCEVLDRIRDSWLTLPDPVITQVLTHLEPALERGLHPQAWIAFDRIRGKLSAQGHEPSLDPSWALEALRHHPSDAPLAKAITSLYGPFVTEFRTPSPELAQTLLPATLGADGESSWYLMRCAGDGAYATLLEAPPAEVRLDVIMHAMDLVSMPRQLHPRLLHVLLQQLQAAPSEEGIAEIVRVVEWLLIRISDEPPSQDIVEGIAELWGRMWEVAPEAASFDVAYMLRTSELTERVLPHLLASPPSDAGVGAVLSALTLTPYDDRDGVLQRHQARVLPLLAHGLASDDPNVRRTTLQCLNETQHAPWLAPVLHERLEAGDAEVVDRLLVLVPSEPDTIRRALGVVLRSDRRPAWLSEWAYEASQGARSLVSLSDVLPDDLSPEQQRRVVEDLFEYALVRIDRRDASRAQHLLAHTRAVVPEDQQPHWILLDAMARDSPEDPAFADLVRAGDAGVLLAGLRAHVAIARPDRLAGLAQELSSRCIRHGDPDVAVEIVDAVVQEVPAGRRPDLIYNQACAHAVAGRAEAAVASLQRAVDLDPTQAADARADTDFDAMREHPNFVVLTSP